MLSPLGIALTSRELFLLSTVHPLSPPIPNHHVPPRGPRSTMFCAASCAGSVLDCTDLDAVLHPLDELATAMVPDDAAAESGTASP